MIPLEFEYLFEKNSYQFYKYEEYGFSNTEISIKHKLYEDFSHFGHTYSSTYLDIFENELHFDDKISQIWIFKDNIPIGLGMAIHHSKNHLISSQEKNISSICLGHIHLYISPKERGQGLAKEMVPLLESSILDNQENLLNPSIIMQDDAFLFRHYLLNTIALPNPLHDDPKNENLKCILSKFSNLNLNEKIITSTDYNRVKENILSNRASFIDGIEDNGYILAQNKKIKF